MAADLDMNEIHWLMDMFNTVDVGLVVLDRDYRVCVWNGFMENHSGLLPSAVKHKDLFDLFPAIDEKWFRSKSESVFVLKNARSQYGNNSLIYLGLKITVLSLVKPSICIKMQLLYL